MTIADDMLLRIERFEQLAVEWVKIRWSGRGKVDWFVGRCRPSENRWLKSNADPEDRLFADFLATFLDNQGEAAKICFDYTQGWKVASHDPIAAAQKVVAWLVRQRGVRVFGNHRKYTSSHAFPQALKDYVTLTSSHSNEDSPSQVRLFQAAHDFDSVYELVRHGVSSFDRLGSWDYLVRAYTDRITTLSNSFDFEPKTLHLDGGTGPKEGWELVLIGSTEEGRQLTKELLGLADQAIRNVVKATGLTGPEYRPFVWFETEDLLCNCQKDKKVKVNGKTTTISKLTEEYLNSGTQDAMNRLLSVLE